MMVAIAFALAGCGSDPVQQPGAVLWTPTPPASPAAGEQRWSGRITVDRDTGAISAAEFNTLVDSAAPSWARSLDTAAAELLGLNGPFDGRPKIYILLEQEPAEPVVTATLTNLGDDSIRAERYRVVFRRGDDGRYRFVAGMRTTQCQPDRGHQSFQVGTCR
jgi:hypothetical protein